MEEIDKDSKISGLLKSLEDLKGKTDLLNKVVSAVDRGKKLSEKLTRRSLSLDELEKLKKIATIESLLLCSDSLEVRRAAERNLLELQKATFLEIQKLS